MTSMWPLLLQLVFVISPARAGSAGTLSVLPPTGDSLHYSEWSGSQQVRCGVAACVNGQCVDGRCACHAGWRGTSCQLCGGRVRLTSPEGVITHGVGNYSTNMQCTWLIDAPFNTSVQLFIERFATECGWDHVYVFDGDNIYSDQLAVYSGLVQLEDYSTEQSLSLEARSGSAYIHFFSDAAYNMTGFKITYKYNSCPSVSGRTDCSGHGTCDPVTGTCRCQAGWTGRACHLEHCPGACNGHGRCDHQKKACVCNEGYKGHDCNQREELGYWEQLPRSEYVPPGRASHASVVKGDSIWLLGGVSFVDTDFVIKYDINGGVWEPYHTRGTNQPRNRYGHTAVLRGDNVYMFGGVEYTSGQRVGVMTPTATGPISGVSDQLWALDTSTRTWEPVHVKADRCYRRVCGPLAVAGHSAVVASHDRMLVLFGHSPVYGYLNYIQIYHFGTGMWSVEGPGLGALVKGCYGHSSTWDPGSKLVYVYGGHLSSTIASYSLSSLLHAFDPDTMVWTRLTPSESPRFLHAAALLGGVLLVFGGNTHNDTVHSGGAHCYSHQLLGYDVQCDQWHVVGSAGRAAARYGHTANVFDGQLYVAAGYSGRMLSHLDRFTPAQCSAFGASRRSCLLDAPGAGVKCAWNRKSGRCQPREQASAKTHALCAGWNDTAEAADLPSVLYQPSAEDLCSAISSCPTCLNSVHDCVWCGTNCSHRKCADGSKPISEESQCQPNYSSNCILLHNCHACHTEPYCKWEHDHKCYTYIEKRENRTKMVMKISQEPCGPSCSERLTCSNCTAANCMWCINQMRCVENNAYVVSFPYGQCIEWTTLEKQCDAQPMGGNACRGYKTCERCQRDAGCGWCDTGAGTGLGTCMPGGYSSPVAANSCSSTRWNFLSCPPCQCNGHSTCYPGNSTCRPCGDLTTGAHCDTCQLGYFGDPVNGGHCQLCSCNNHGADCHPHSGKCYCDTKGMIGKQCDRCDTLNKFIGDPSIGEQCFYKLALDFQFTFNLTKPEDLHYRQINFLNQPKRSDLNTDFHITCSVPAKMNITYKSVLEPVEQPVLTEFNCTQHEYTFSQSEFSFGAPANTTFLVYVYQLRPPLFVQVAFSQNARLNLRQFFITFSTCFLLLLVIAALLWKVKQKIDSYRRRQRMFVEMEQMASRPYARALIELDSYRYAVQPFQYSTHTSLNVHSHQSNRSSVPCAIALEPCAGNRAALLTVLIECPTGGSRFSPPGLSGIITGTALVADGSSRKASCGFDTTLTPAGGKLMEKRHRSSISPTGDPRV